MSHQHLLAQLRQEHQQAIERHRNYITTHERIIQIVLSLEQEGVTDAEALAQLQALADSVKEPGLVALYRQTIERLRRRGEKNV